MKKTQLIIGFVALAAVWCLYVYAIPSFLLLQKIPVSSAIAMNTGTEGNTLPAYTTAISATPSPAPTTAATPSAQSPAANVTLKAGDRTYGAYVVGSESVLELMRSLASTSGFTFTGEDYPSLGFFVESINGEKNGDGEYWILYINGKSSNLGASNAIIKSGDTVAWRLEKSYK